MRYPGLLSYLPSLDSTSCSTGPHVGYMTSAMRLRTTLNNNHNEVYNLMAQLLTLYTLHTWHVSIYVDQTSYYPFPTKETNLSFSDPV